MKIQNRIQRSDRLALFAVERKQQHPRNQPVERMLIRRAQDAFDKCSALIFRREKIAIAYHAKNRRLKRITFPFQRRSQHSPSTVHIAESEMPARQFTPDARLLRAEQIEQPMSKRDRFSETPVARQFHSRWPKPCIRTGRKQPLHHCRADVFGMHLHNLCKSTAEHIQFVRRSPG